MRFLGYLIFLVLIGYGLYPYYSVYRLDDAIHRQGVSEVSALVDLPAIRANYKRRVTAGVNGILPTSEPNSFMSTLRENLDKVGDAAFEQFLTLEWARETVTKAINHTNRQGQATSDLFSAIDFAFFESYNRFLVRIGELGQGATHVRFSLEDKTWKITDIIL